MRDKTLAIIGQGYVGLNLSIMASKNQTEIDKIIDLYFNQPKILYEHLFASFHQFIEEIIPYSLIQEPNVFYESINKEFIYYHGFKCSNIRIKPSTFDNDNEIKFPLDARKNHLNYFATVIADTHRAFASLKYDPLGVANVMK